MKKKTTLSSRKHFYTYLLLLMTVALITSFFAISSISGSIRFEKLSILSRARTLMERAELEIQLDLNQAVQKAESLCSQQYLQNWFSGAEFPIYKNLALDELEAIMTSGGYAMSFAANAQEKVMYFGNEVFDVLDINDPDDSWYFDFLEMGKRTVINVDHNKELGQTMLWVNSLVEKEGEFLGVAGVGMEINDIIDRLGYLAPGENGMILIADEMGRIQLAYPEKWYNHNLSELLNDKNKVYIDLENFSINDVPLDNSIYVSSRIENLDMLLVVVVSIGDFLFQRLFLTRFFTVLSLCLILLLAFAFLIIIFKLKKTITQQNISQDMTIYSMSMLAELKDNETGAHIIRTKKYCRILAEELNKQGHYKKYMSAGYIEDLERSAPLHDIGKVGIPDSILLKPAKLTKEEFEIIKSHTTMGAKVLQAAMKQSDFMSYFTIGIQLVRYHHEKWDGTGYPEGLEGEMIPLSARIMAIADVYDALRTKRPYKEPFSHSEAKKIIQEGKGSHFQPQLVDAFISRELDFKKISEKFKDESEEKAYVTGYKL